MEQEEIELKLFNVGMVNETRNQIQGAYSYLENFDNRFEKGALIPKPLIEKDSGSYDTTHMMKTFDYASTGNIYGLGDQRLDLLTSPFTGSPVWSSVINGFDGSLHPSNPEAGVLIYKNFVYWLVNSKTFQRYGDISGSPSWNATFAAFANTITVTCPLFLGKDSNFYIGYKDNAGLTKLARLTSGGTLTEGVLTLPNDMTIVSLAWYDSYLAIGCTPDLQTREATLYLWDYSQPDVQDSIQYGQNTLRGICRLGDSILLALEKPSSKQVRFDFYPKNSVVLPKFTPQDSTTPQVYFSPRSLSTASFKMRTYDNGVYMGIQYTFDTALANTLRTGILKIGRDKPGDAYSMTIDGRLGTETGQITDVLQLGITRDDMIYATYTDSSHTSVFTTKTGFGTATIQTLIYSSKNVDAVKQLDCLSLSFKPLPSGGQVVVKYRVDGATAWTTIFTENTAGAITHESNGIESDNSSFAQFKEVEFQVISTGGAVPNGFKFKCTPTQNLYNA